MRRFFTKSLKETGPMVLEDNMVFLEKQTKREIVEEGQVYNQVYKEHKVE